MLRLVLTLTLVAIAYAGHSRIAGGSFADIEKYYYQVTIRRGSFHFCGGALLTPSVVVTTAHGVYGYEELVDRFAVAAGSSYIYGGEKRDVKEIHTHELYNRRTIDYDVAIVIVAKPFELAEDIGLIQLIPKNFNIEPSTIGELTGWGAKSTGGDFNPSLQFIKAPSVAWDVCEGIYPVHGFSKRMSCWGDTDGGQGFCKGDEGGPLVIYSEVGKPLLAGVASWGAGCAIPNYPGVYTNVADEEIQDFILKFL